MSYVLVKVHCPNYKTPKVKMNNVRVTVNNTFIYEECRKQVQFINKYHEVNLWKKQVYVMKMLSTGILNTAYALKIRTVTMILTPRLWFKTHLEPSLVVTYKTLILTKC